MFSILERYCEDAMGDNLPYMVSPGTIPKILGKIAEARRPDRFTQDFLEVKLGFPGGSARPIIPLLKRIGFLSSDGTPTKLYDSFRNAGSAGAAMAEGMKIGYKEIFDRNEYAYDMPREKLQALVVEMTGLEKDNRVAQSIVATFWALKEFANFEVRSDAESVPLRADVGVTNDRPAPLPKPPVDDGSRQMELRVGYTINLNLPETTDPDVFNAIFRALKENLL
jgi:Family of unknown function (DUF5343)